MDEQPRPDVPVTFETCWVVEGPFFHGTRHALAVGDELVVGRGSSFQRGRVSNHVYFSAVLETAVWGAELSVALAEVVAGDPEREPQGEPQDELRDERRGHVYLVEPSGPFEDDPNVTDRRFPGNPTRSFRTRHPMRVVGEIADWPAHSAEVLERMLDNLARLREQGLDVIED